MNPVLDITDLHVHYGAAPAVAGVSLQVQPGEVVALVGASGSGKSTLAHAVLQLGDGAVTAGRIDFAGTRIDRLPERDLRVIRGAGIGFVPQDPAVALNPVQRIGTQIAEVLRLHGRTDRRSAPAQVRRVLADAQVDRPELRARQLPHQLSGGQRQRILIGIALACAPRLLIADEPTSALDATVARKILDHLAARCAATNTAVLLITHDLALAADRADRVLVLRDGQLVESGAPAAVLGRPQHAYTKELVGAAPGSGTPRPTAPTTAPLLSYTGVNRSFRLDRHTTVTAAIDVSLDVPRGQTLALVGESGSGKTTLARMALRLEVPDSGRVHFDGIDLAGLRPREVRALRRRMQYVYQNPYASLNPKLRVRDLIAEPLRAFGIGERERRVTELLDQVALPARSADARPGELSGGQRQRVAIARALALRPELLVLDEPVSALDAAVQAQVLELLDTLQRDLTLTYLLISHDLAVVRHHSDQVAVMSGGRIVERGPTPTVFAAPAHAYTRELLDAIPTPLERTAL